MAEEIKDKYSNPNSCEQTVSAGVFGVATSTTGIIEIEDFYNLLCNGTPHFNSLGKTTGVIFQIDLVGDCITKSAFSPNNYLESILNFLDIVNNKNGWSFLQQSKYVNSIVNN